MQLYSEGKNYKLYFGNMLDMLDVIEPNSIDAVVTDPPYELGFMNKGWDSSGIAFQKETWEKCFTALKPGGYMMAFGGSRTYHRIACAIEDAGFEIRDTIQWIYGSGFPKSMNISKGIEARECFGKASTEYKRIIEQSGDGAEYTVVQTNNGAMGEKYEATRKEYTPKSPDAQKWKGWGTTLKPCYEPIIIARKPCEGSCIENVLKYGVGGINIDECRIPFQSDEDYAITANKNQHEKFGTKPMTNNTVYGDYSMVQPKNYESDGRFPSNVILTYDDDNEKEVCGNMPYSKGASSQNNYSNGHIYRGQSLNESSTTLNGFREWYNDEGSASRYFMNCQYTEDDADIWDILPDVDPARYYYCAKASNEDRDEGLDSFESRKCSMMATNGSIDKDGNFTGMLRGRDTRRRNIHPTVKPCELMKYLIRLVTPKGGTVLDPFNGSGSTGKACMLESLDKGKDYKYIGIELTEEYLPIAEARISYAVSHTSGKNRRLF